MAKRLLIAAEADRALVARAKADGRFDVVDHPVRSEDELAAIVGDCEILVTRSYNRVTRRVLDAAPHLELIAQGTSGTDNIDAAAAAARGITILNLPGANANAVAELVIGHIIALTRTVPAYNAQMRGGIWNRGDCPQRPARSSTFPPPSPPSPPTSFPAWRSMSSIPSHRCARGPMTRGSSSRRTSPAARTRRVLVSANYCGIVLPNLS